MDLSCWVDSVRRKGGSSNGRLAARECRSTPISVSRFPTPAAGGGVALHPRRGGGLLGGPVLQSGRRCLAARQSGLWPPVAACAGGPSSAPSGRCRTTASGRRTPRRALPELATGGVTLGCENALWPAPPAAVAAATTPNWRMAPTIPAVELREAPDRHSQPACLAPPRAPKAAEAALAAPAPVLAAWRPSRPWPREAGAGPHRPGGGGGTTPAAGLAQPGAHWAPGRRGPAGALAGGIMGGMPGGPR